MAETGSDAKMWHVVVVAIVLFALLGYFWYMREKNPEWNPFSGPNFYDAASPLPSSTQSIFP